jgi:uracil-DNA glycosylase
MDIYRELKKSLPEGWEDVFREAMSGIKDACNIIENDKINYFPPPDKVFNAYRLVKPTDVRVVIIGQDPYHTPGAANGLAFSCNTKVPPLLGNIYKELAKDIPGFVIPNHGDLTAWCKQGIFLFNISLTAKGGIADYKPAIWMDITDATISHLTSTNRNIIWVLWGEKAQTMGKLIKEKGIKLVAGNPNPNDTRGGFLGCKHFSKINKILTDRGDTPIDWNLIEDN